MKQFIRNIARRVQRWWSADQYHNAIEVVGWVIGTVICAFLIFSGWRIRGWRFTCSTKLAFDNPSVRRYFAASCD